MELNTQNPTAAIRGKPLVTTEWSEELGGWLIRTDQMVPHGTVPETTTTTWSVTVVNERNTQQSRLLTEHLQTDDGQVVNYPLASVTCSSGESVLAQYACCLDEERHPVDALAAIAEKSYGTIASIWQRKNDKVALVREVKVRGGTFQPKQFKSTDEDGSFVVTTETIVPTGTALPANTATIEYESKHIDCQHTLQLAKEVATPGSLTWEGEDEEFCIKLTYVRSDVTTGTFTQSPGTSYDVKPKGSKRFVRTTATLQGWSTWSRESYRTIGFSFPTYVTGFSTIATFVRQQLRTDFKLDISRRLGFSAPTKARVVETLVSSPPVTSESLFSAKETDLGYNGILFSIPGYRALVDATTLTATTNSSDTYYGSAVESYTIPASSPTASAYALLIGSEVCISDDCVPLTKYCLYKRTRVYITLR